jgi:chemotaxis methyl-accepting protein methylase
MSTQLARVAELVRVETGLVLGERQYPALREALGRATGSTDAAAFLRLAADPLERAQAIARLIDETTIQETYFLRDRNQLESIDWRLALSSADGVVRVWDAACATGEEAYSLALLASEQLGLPEPPVRVLATDISERALAQARGGVYGPRAVREVEPRLRQRYLHEREESFEVHERLRRLVTFASHNLVRDPIPPPGELPFDLIVCRNVLIYFDAATVASLVGQLEAALRPGGVLVLGAADVLCVTAPRLERLSSGRAAPGGRRRAPQRPAGERAERRPRPQAAAAKEPNEEQHFVQGLAELEAGRFDHAVAAFRRALYLNPAFGLAAFQLGRAHEAAGDVAAAKRAYGQALRTIDLADDRHDHLIGQVDLGDVATACRARLEAL